MADSYVFYIAHQHQPLEARHYQISLIPEDFQEAFVLDGKISATGARYEAFLIIALKMWNDHSFIKGLSRTFYFKTGSVPRVVLHFVLLHITEQSHTETQWKDFFTSFIPCLGVVVKSGGL